MPEMNLDVFKKLVDQIEMSLDQELHVLQLTQSTGLSSWHFQRLFKALVGDSLGAYVRGRRLSKAAELLRLTNQGLLDIALEVGFNSHEAFSRSFKAYFNITPTEVREKKLKLKIREKPLLTDELLKFLSTRIDREPEITTLPSKRIIGHTLEIESPFIDRVDCTTIADPWMRLLKDIPNLGIDMKTVELHGITQSLSGTFTEEKLIYLAGVKVSLKLPLPYGMSEFVLPEQKVAIFQVATHVADDNLKQKVDSIYGYWLMNNKYNRGVGHDYELFKNVVDPMLGMFDSYYVIPIGD